MARRESVGYGLTCALENDRLIFNWHPLNRDTLGKDINNTIRTLVQMDSLKRLKANMWNNFSETKEVTEHLKDSNYVTTRKKEKCAIHVTSPHYFNEGSSYPFWGVKFTLYKASARLTVCLYVRTEYTVEQLSRLLRTSSQAVKGSLLRNNINPTGDSKDLKGDEFFNRYADLIKTASKKNKPTFYHNSVISTLLSDTTFLKDSSDAELRKYPNGPYLYSKVLGASGLTKKAKDKVAHNESLLRGKLLDIDTKMLVLSDEVSDEELEFIDVVTEHIKGCLLLNSV